MLASQRLFPMDALRAGTILDSSSTISLRPMHICKNHADRLSSDFAMLERDERWSLYFFYRNGEVTLMFQFSEVKPEHQGITNPDRADFARYLYDYAKKPYGIDWELAAAKAGIPDRAGVS